MRTVHEALAHVTASRTISVGALGDTGGSIGTPVDMNAEYGFGATHSAEWVKSYQETRAFYVRLLSEYNLNPIQ